MTEHEVACAVRNSRPPVHAPTPGQRQQLEAKLTERLEQSNFKQTFYNQITNTALVVVTVVMLNLVFPPSHGTTAEYVAYNRAPAKLSLPTVEPVSWILKVCSGSNTLSYSAYCTGRFSTSTRVGASLVAPSGDVVW